MRTKTDIIAAHYSCTCDKIYTSRKMVDPSCVLHDAGPEIELIMDEYKDELLTDAINSIAQFHIYGHSTANGPLNAAIGYLQSMKTNQQEKSSLK